MKCESCGGEIPIGEVNCPFCGSARRIEDSADQPRKEIFARIRRSPEFAGLSLQGALDSIPQIGMFAIIFPGCFGVIFTGLALGMAVFAYDMGAPMIFTLFPIGIGAFGAFALGGVVLRGLRARGSDPVARPAIVVAKRTEVSGGGKNSSASTHYYATFEFENGQREEFGLETQLYSNLAERDAGMLFTRADWVAKFVLVT